MDRREFICGITGSLLAAPRAAEAQQAAKVYRLGLLGGSPPNSPGGRRAWEGFFQGMRELGYVEGQNILVEGRWYGEQTDRLPGLAAELVQLKVDVIVAGARRFKKRLLGRDAPLTTMTQKELWERVHASFEWHRRAAREPDTQTTLDRIAAKCITKQPHAKATCSFDASNCVVREERLSPNQLCELQRYHDRAVPARDVEPIVVLVYEGHKIVIEGNTRANKWCAEGGTRLRSVIFIESKESVTKGHVS